MIIFKDIISGDELFSDTFRYELIDNCVYRVKGKTITISDNEDFDIGANPSAEEASEDVAAGSTSGVDVILSCRLSETAFKKKEYQVYIKGYMKSIKEKLEAEGKDIKEFTSGASKFVKGLLDDFSEWQFFQGEKMDPDAMIVLMKWDEETPYVYFFKHGLDEEKV